MNDLPQMENVPGPKRLADAPGSASEGKQSPFYIAAAGPSGPPRCILKHNDCFAVLDDRGDIGRFAGGADGIFSRDTRYLSYLALSVNGMQLLLLGSSMRDDNLNYRTDLTNPDILAGEDIALLKDTIHIGRSAYLHDGALAERRAITNHGTDPVRIELSIAFDNDFADLFEVRGMQRPARGTVEKKVVAPNKIVFRYLGLDAKERETVLIFHPTPDELYVNEAKYFLNLEPLAPCYQFMSVSCGEGTESRSATSFFRGMLRSRRQLVSSGQNEVAAIETSNAVFNEVLCRSLADLRMLTTETPEGKYPYAGIPWYSATFGRDGLLTALQLLWFDPTMARGVLRRLAKLQASKEDAAADAQPGKILHEMRLGEMAALGEVPFGLYYGSVDATPLFVLLAGLYAERTGDYDLIDELWPNIERALDWIGGPGDPDGDGFVEYARASESGLANQGWKDSHDSIFHQDGSLAEGPIALVEVQGYVYAALRAAGACAAQLGYAVTAAKLYAKANDLRQRFEQEFWCEDLGTYAIALDGKKRPCRVRSSNAAQTLFTGIVSPERARRVAAGLLRPELNSGWGIRTIAAGEARYNPMSYHNGSVWPHDNAMIALGLAKYGFTDAIAPIFNGIMQAAAYMDQRRLPELFCGFQRRRNRGPTLYPVACAPQAWASGSVFLFLQAILGLEYDVPSQTVTLRNPCIPASAGEIVIRNFRLGNGAISFSVQPGEGGTVSLRVLDSTGQAKISVAMTETGNGHRPQISGIT